MKARNVHANGSYRVLVMQVVAEALAEPRRLRFWVT
jgi:hypothetical protein